MHLLLVLAQAANKAPPPPPTASFEAGQWIGRGIGLLIMLAMTIGGVYVIKNWPSQRRGRLPIGALLVILPWSGPLLSILNIVSGGQDPLETILVIALMWVLWLMVYAFARIQMRLENERFASQDAIAPPRQATSAQPYSAAPGAFSGPPPQQPPECDGEVAAEPEQAPRTANAGSRAQVSADTPVIARCGSCMGRWRTTAGEAKALQACPKCGVSPPRLRLQRA